MQSLLIILAAAVCFAFAVHIARRGLEVFRSGSKLVGGFIVVVSVQFFIYPVLMLITVFG